MKKTLTILLGAFLLVLTLSLLLSCADTSDTGGAKSTDGNTAETTTAPITAPEGSYLVPISVYLQDPESGEYELIAQKSECPPIGMSVTYTPDARDYYIIDSERSTFTATSEGESIEVYYTCELCTVTFQAENATVEDGTLTQTLRKGQTPTPPTLSRKGYTCIGYDQPIDKVYTDTVYTAIFEVTKYTLYLYATADTVLPEGFTPNGQTDGCFTATYTVEDSITLPKPQSAGYTFVEWNTAPDGKGQTLTEITKGTEDDTSLYAIYTVKLYSITFVANDGAGYPAYYHPYNTPISAPTVPPEAQKAGFGLSWYTDSACTKLYDFHLMPADNITLYGKWEKDTGEGFLSLGDDFSSFTVDSLDDLVILLDYIRFHDLKDSLKVEVTYTDKAGLETDIKKAQRELVEFRGSGSIAYGIATSGMKDPNAKCILSIHVGTSYRDVEATRTAASGGTVIYHYLTSEITPRGESYTELYVEKLTKTYPVSTSNQLLYVLEHGYRPLPEKDSPAERVYLTAKTLLNTILPENASDVEKAELIYNYLVSYIEYDHKAVEIAEDDASIWPEYDAFFLEGVLLRQKAVCDGIAAAYSLLCNMEGIPCVKILGEGHAWNRVKVANRWYVVDATFGVSQVVDKNYSLPDHTHFLISDAEKEARGNIGYNYKSIKAEKNYGYYEKKQITYKNRSFDFEIGNATELANFLEYVNSLIDTSQNTSVNFHCSSKNFNQLYNEAQRILWQRGVSLKTTPSILQNDGLYQFTFEKKASKNPYSVWNRDFFRCYVRCKVLCSDDLEFDRRARFLANVYLRKRGNARDRNAVLCQENTGNRNRFDCLVDRARADSLQLDLFAFAQKACNCACHQIGIGFGGNFEQFHSTPRYFGNKGITRRLSPHTAFWPKTYLSCAKESLCQNSF